MTFGGAASSIVDGLKQSPGTLAVLTLQVVMLAVLYLVNSANATHQQEREMFLLQKCFERTDAIVP